jgi:hypothetical protein
MNEPSMWAFDIPPLFFHYVIVFITVSVIGCICILKFKYFYWYQQPVSFRYTIRRFFRMRNGSGRHRTTVMNPLSLGERCYNAVVYPFLHHVNHNAVRVFRGSDNDVPFERISQLLRHRAKDEGVDHQNAGLIAGYSCETLRLILSQDTFGLSAFIGLYYNNTDVIKGVSVITPRIMISFDSSLPTSKYHSVSIYMSDYLAWNKYTMTERESLELIETTEHIQKSQEIAGEQTLYCYREIPWIVIPFSTVFSYVFRCPSLSPQTTNGHGITVVRVSSTNFALFYSFVNERTRDFRTCILNELTQLQSLVEHGLYKIYMLLLNDMRVIAVYLFTQTTLLNPQLYQDSLGSTAATAASSRSHKKKTKGNRIADLHNYVSKTSTALVKYLPPVIPPIYDAFGKRISIDAQSSSSSSSAHSRTHRTKSREYSVMRLISSIQHKTLCETNDFLHGFQYICASNAEHLVTIDTLAHNHRLIDALLSSSSSSSS